MMNTTANITPNNAIESAIMEMGYVNNNHLFRRWTTAQMIKMLEYKGKNGNGYNAYLNEQKTWRYQFTMLVDELKILAKLERDSAEELAERTAFFNMEIVKLMFDHYVNDFVKFVDKLPRKNKDGKKYVRIHDNKKRGNGGHVDVFVDELDDKLLDAIKARVNHIKKAKNYAELYKRVWKFVNVSMIDLPNNTKKYKEWMEAYKGNGSYYVMRDRIMFDNCFIHLDDGTVLDTEASLAYIKSFLEEYKGSGYKYHAMMKKFIVDNGYDFHEKMRQKYGELPVAEESESNNSPFNF